MVAGLVKKHGIYSLDVMKLDACSVECSQPNSEQLTACIESREVRL